MGYAVHFRHSARRTLVQSSPSTIYSRNINGWRYRHVADSVPGSSV